MSPTGEMLLRVFDETSELLEVVHSVDELLNELKELLKD